MVDAKVSALTAASALDGTESFYVVQGGASRKVSLSTLNAYFEPLGNASTAAQSPAANTDTYITGSNITLPPARLQAGTMYRLRLMVSKTAAGTAAPVFTVRTGTAGTTADTSRCALTMGAQTATANAQVMLELLATFRAVGSGTTGVLVASIGGSIAGFPTAGATATSTGFDTTTANVKIGVSLNTGASAAWTITQAQADMLNLL